VAIKEEEATEVEAMHQENLISDSNHDVCSYLRYVYLAPQLTLVSFYENY